jgi:hypothetical protein
MFLRTSMTSLMVPFRTFSFLDFLQKSISVASNLFACCVFSVHVSPCILKYPKNKYVSFVSRHFLYYSILWHRIFTSQIHIVTCFHGLTVGILCLISGPSCESYRLRPQFWVK